MSRKKEKEELLEDAEEGKKCGCGKPKKLLFIALVVALAVKYSQLDESKKRFIKHLAKQVPYLPGRYYA
jgi:hypothetical protein